MGHALRKELFEFKYSFLKDTVENVIQVKDLKGKRNPKHIVLQIKSFTNHDFDENLIKIGQELRMLWTLNIVTFVVWAPPF